MKRCVVAEHEILELYLAIAYTVHVARQTVGAEAEDVVRDAVTWLLEKRDYLRDAPGGAYFLTAVRNTAVRRFRYAWARQVVAVDPEMLVIIDAQVQARPGHVWAGPKSAAR